jgi:hypothetical protein
MTSIYPRSLQRNLSTWAVTNDDTTVPVLAPGLGRTKTGRLWAVVRDERTWAGAAPPAAFYCYSPDRRGERAEALLGQCRGFLHADGYGGFNSLYVREPKTGRPRLTEVACWAHPRRKIYEVYEATAAPLAEEALDRIAELFAIEARALSERLVPPSGSCDSGLREGTKVRPPDLRRV